HLCGHRLQSGSHPKAPERADRITVSRKDRNSRSNLSAATCRENRADNRKTPTKNIEISNDQTFAAACSPWTTFLKAAAPTTPAWASRSRP
ncbi:hypothetical protein, partial [Mesorhizobium sp. M0843]|uniref:hypothetical protein n=1 Tax=Mesorhizobium sp. M0843 TaxID=2957010 RepID=UPI003336486A